MFAKKERKKRGGENGTGARVIAMITKGNTRRCPLDFQTPYTYSIAGQPPSSKFKFASPSLELNAVGDLLKCVDITGGEMMRNVKVVEVTHVVSHPMCRTRLRLPPPPIPIFTKTGWVMADFS